MKAVDLVRLREHLRLSVEQLAEQLGVNASTVYGWERGEHAIGNKRVRAILEDLYDKAFGAPWDRERARLEVGKRLGVDADRAGQLLHEYGRLDPGEPWRDVVGRVVDGERYHRLGRVAEA